MSSISAKIELNGTSLSEGWLPVGSSGLPMGNIKVSVYGVYSGKKASVKIVNASGIMIKDMGMVDSTAQWFSYGNNSYSVKVTNTNIESNCSSNYDDVCPPWCSAGSDYDCVRR